ncbi:MAG TPA: VOC family protein [Candidatus Udaeobacter sp.]|nr:VOC family protein [Candidatus Udaeobacter sp.]
MAGSVPPRPLTPTAGLLRRVSLTIILVSDLPRSVHFYRDQLGLPLVAESPDWAEFRLGDTRIALQAGGDPTIADPHSAAGHINLSFEVDDVVEAYEVLKAAGVTFLRPPAEQDFGFLAVLKDPDGREIMIVEPR